MVSVQLAKMKGSTIPFPVCEYAANHYREGRRLWNISNYIEGIRLKNKIKKSNIK